MGTPMVGIKDMSGYVSSIPGMVRRVPEDGEVVVTWLKGQRVIATAVGPVETWLPGEVLATMLNSGADGMLGASFNLTDEQADLLISRLAILEPRFHDWYAVVGEDIYSIRTNEVGKLRDWRTTEVAAHLALNGVPIAEHRSDVMAETQPNDVPPTTEHAALVEAMEDIGSRDQYLHDLAAIEDVSELMARIEKVAEAGRRFPTAGTATVAALGYMLSGDMMRARFWATRALELDTGYTLAQLALTMLAIDAPPEGVREALLAINE